MPSQKLWMTTTRRVASARRIVRVRTVVPPRVNVSRLAVLRLTRSVVETLPATSLDPLDCSFSGSFAAQSSRPPTSDNVRYVAFNSKNRLDIRTNTKTVAESLMSIHRNGLGRFPRVRPCSPWLFLAAHSRTTGNTGGHGEEEVLTDQGTHSNRIGVGVAAERSDAAPGNPWLVFCFTTARHRLAEKKCPDDMGELAV